MAVVRFLCHIRKKKSNVKKIILIKKIKLRFFSRNKYKSFRFRYSEGDISVSEKKKKRFNQNKNKKHPQRDNNRYKVLQSSNIKANVYRKSILKKIFQL